LNDVVFHTSDIDFTANIVDVQALGIQNVSILIDGVINQPILLGQRGYIISLFLEFLTVTIIGPSLHTTIQIIYMKQIIVISMFGFIVDLEQELMQILTWLQVGRSWTK